MTKICLTSEDLITHTAVIDKWFHEGNYEVVQRWDDGYAAYWVILNKAKLYCMRTFVIAGRVQISCDVDRSILKV